jgi:predicted alpha/beta hydrolase family esterase
VILHGWQGSGPDHWQSWLAEQLRAAEREVRYPNLPDPDKPTLDGWLGALTATLDGLPDDGFDVVAHSLGAVLWLHHASGGRSAPRPARVALVAPPSPATAIPELAPFFPVPLDIDAVRRTAGGGPPANGGVAGGGGTVLVGGDDDPYTPEGVALAYGRPLKMPTTVIAGGGHLNPDSGYGPWPAVLDWCGRDNLAFIG